MHVVMFDIDGTLVESCAFDEACYTRAVEEVTGFAVDTQWANYAHVTDSGILNEVIGNHGLVDAPAIHRAVKARFVRYIADHISLKPVQAVPGAVEFLQHLRQMDDVTVSIATGGWYESACLKLAAAGIDSSGIPMASANDHFSRTEIMQIAASRSTDKPGCRFIYFGDGVWDREACRQLGYDFVLVGNKLDYQPALQDYVSIRKVLASAGIPASGSAGWAG